MQADYLRLSETIGAALAELRGWRSRAFARAETLRLKGRETAS
jgi:hypothetical protein